MKTKYLNLLIVPVLGVAMACNNSNKPKSGTVNNETGKVEKTEVITDSESAGHENHENEFGLVDGQTVISSLPLAEDKVLSIAAKGTTVKWTAFKTTAKAGVGGSFNDFTISEPKPGKDLTEAFVGTTITIATNSVNSNNPTRDERIARAFFGSMTETENIIGEIVHFKDNEAAIKFTMNNITRQVACNYTVESGVITIKGTVDLGNWNGSKAVDALNKECDGLHKGTDGISKLWNEVEIEISATLIEQ